MPPDVPPTVGMDYAIKCTGAVPTSLQGTVMATWIAPDGTVLVSNTSQDMVCLPLTFQPFELEDLGSYRCQIVVSSPFVTGQIGNTATFGIRQVEGTVSPTDTPENTDMPVTIPETTIATTMEPSDPTISTTIMTTTAQETTVIPTTSSLPPIEPTIAQETTMILPTEPTTSDSVQTPTSPVGKCLASTI